MWRRRGGVDCAIKGRTGRWRGRDESDFLVDVRVGGVVGVDATVVSFSRAATAGVLI